VTILRAPHSKSQPISFRGREDSAPIVPIRIAHATTDLDAIKDFYTDVFAATLIYTHDTLDAKHQPLHSVFIALPETHIELQFISRISSSTFGDFTLEVYEDLLMDTHSAILLSPYCGTDRWMDNHFAYATWTIPGLLDHIHERVEARGVHYHAGKSSVEHVSVHTRGQLDAVGFQGNWTFGLWVIEPGGQSVQTGGIISDKEMAQLAFQGSPQWCVWPCENGLEPGKVDETMVYGYEQHQREKEGEGAQGKESVLVVREGVRESEGVDVDVVVAVSVAVLGCAIVGNVLLCVFSRNSKYTLVE